MKQASVHDFPGIEECKLFEGIRCDKCRTCESEMEKWLISKGVRRMTDKRFKFICDDEKCFFKDGNKALYCYEVVDLLNSLSDENEQLKTIIQQLRTDNTKQKKKLNTTMKENEQLKCGNKKLNERIGILEGSLIDKGFDIND